MNQRSIINRLRSPFSRTVLRISLSETHEGQSLDLESLHISCRAEVFDDLGTREVQRERGVDGRGQWVAFFLKSRFRRKRGEGKYDGKITLSLFFSRFFPFLNLSLLRG